MLEDLWLGTFPDAVVTRVPDAGHFVQEDAYEQVVPALLAHLDRVERRGGGGVAESTSGEGVSPLAARVSHVS